MAGRNVFVKNLDFEIDDQLLHAAFSRYGRIQNAKVMRDDAGNSKGFGFVCFSTPEEATRAIKEMHGKKIRSKVLYVNLHQRKEERTAYLTAHDTNPSTGLRSTSQRPLSMQEMQSRALYQDYITVRPSQLAYIKSSSMFHAFSISHNVRFDFDFNDNCLGIKGSCVDVNAAKMEVLLKISELSVRDIKWTHSVLQLLRMKTVRRACLKKFGTVTCGMDISEDCLSLCSDSLKNVEKCQQILYGAICEYNYPEGESLSQTQMDKLQQTHWNQFKASHQQLLNAYIEEDKRRSRVVVACLKESKDDVVKALATFFDYDIEKQLFEGESSRVQYINACGKDWLDKITEAECKHHVTFSRGATADQLFISGAAEGIKQAAAKLKDICFSIKQETMAVPKKVFSKSFASPEGKGKLAKLGEKTQTLIVEKHDLSVASGHVGAESKKLAKSTFQLATRLRLILELGDIATTKADILVDSVGTSLNLSSGKVSCALLQTAGPELQEECHKKSPRGLAVGGMVITPGFKLACSEVFHICCPKWNEGQDSPQLELYRLITRCLDEAKQRGHKAIAFPLIGTGTLGYPHDIAAKTMIDAVLAHNVPSTLEEIKFVIYKDCKAMQRMFEAELLKRKEVQKISDDELTTLVIYGSTAESIALVQRKLQKLIDESLFIKYFSNEKEIVALNHLTNKQKKDLKRAAIVRNVEFSLDGAGLALAGPKHLVLEVSEQVHKELGRSEAARLLHLIVEWQVQRGDQWEPIGDELINKEIEEAFQGKRNTVRYTSHDGAQMEIDLISKRLINHQTRNKYKVQRVEKTQDIPAHWQHADGYAEFILAPSSPEYQTVLQDFMTSAYQQWRVLEIRRIQNPHLYAQYSAQKKKVQSSLIPGVILERSLWHGSSGDNVLKICQEGFNRSYSGANAFAFGHGSYFAVNARYSCNNKYSVVNGQGHKYIMRCKVITGQFCLGNPSMKTAPYKQGTVDRYDSTADHSTHPTMFVVYHDAAAYPDYIIRFH